MPGMMKRFVLIVVVLMIAACSAPIKKGDIEKIRTVGVVNNFPVYPNFIVIGTTVFNNTYHDIEDPGYYQEVTNVVVNYLQGKGYEVVLLKEKDDDGKNNVDLLLELIPRDMYNMPGTYGYGVNQRSFFGLKNKAIVYVALNIAPYINGKSQGSVFYQQSIVPLDIDVLPETWEMLSRDQKYKIESILNEKINQTLTELLIKVGI